ncbi:MAG: hypothetical protein ACJ72N_07455 [Labedaea sp.]
MTKQLSQMTSFERDAIIGELRQLSRPDVLKTDDESARDRSRVAEICQIFNADYPEDVLDLLD